MIELNKIYCGDTTRTDSVTGYVMMNLSPTFLPDAKLSKLFGLEKSIGRSRSQLKERRAPGGYEKVDILFQEDSAAKLAAFLLITFFFFCFSNQLI